MNNLNQERIEQIEKIANKWFEEKEFNIYNHYDTRPAFIEGYQSALTNPTIFQSAGLMSVDEMVDFYKWATFNKWELWCHTNWVNKNHTGVLTTTELLTIFRNQNK